MNTHVLLENTDSLHANHHHTTVIIAKNILKKSRHEDPYLALLAYRNTPQQWYNYSPAQRLMSRRLHDIIPTAPRQLIPQTVSPSLVQENIGDRRRRSKAQYDKRASTPLTEFSPTTNPGSMGR